MRARDVSVDIAKGIGILSVVGFHCAFVFADMRHNVFDMPLFYFVSGFFLYRYITTDYSTRDFIIKKCKNLLVPYFVYNFMFGVITYILLSAGIYIQKGSSHIFSVRNLFIEPFISGHQYAISCPMWFVPSLFLVMCCICILKYPLRYMFSGKSRIFLLVVLLVGIFYASTLIQYKENKYIAVASRTSIGFVFCILGCLYYRYKKIYPSLILLFAIIIYVAAQMLVMCATGQYSMTMSVVWNIYPTGVSRFVVLPLSLSGVLIILAISELIQKYGRFVCANDLAWLGRNSFHVMAIHLSGFLLLNIIICVFSTHTVSEITNVYFRFQNMRWLYFFFSVTFCYFAIQYAQALAAHLRQRWLSAMNAGNMR